MIGREGVICPGKDKGAASAQIAAGNCVTASNKLSEEERRLGSA